jgi:hypothetical protein
LNANDSHCSYIDLDALAYANLGAIYEGKTNQLQAAKDNYLAAIQELKNNPTRPKFAQPFRGLAALYERADQIEPARQYNKVRRIVNCRRIVLVQRGTNSPRRMVALSYCIVSIRDQP